MRGRQSWCQLLHLFQEWLALTIELRSQMLLEFDDAKMYSTKL